MIKKLINKFFSLTKPEKKSFHKDYATAYPAKSDPQLGKYLNQYKKVDSELQTEKTTTYTVVKEKKVNTNLKKEYQTLTPKEIALHFKISTQKINKIFLDLGWTEKKEQWTIATVLGKNIGATEAYNHKSKTKYVVWNKNILDNETLISKIIIPKKKQKTTYAEKQKKGSDYECYVATVYRERGYHVTEHGKEMGKKDHGIDLIAKKEKEIILIQCKNYKKDTTYKIRHKDIKAFQTDARTYVEDRPLLRTCSLKARYIMSDNFIHASAVKHIEEMKSKGKELDYEIIKIET